MHDTVKLWKRSLSSRRHTVLAFPHGGFLSSVRFSMHACYVNAVNVCVRAHMRTIFVEAFLSF